MGTILNVAGIAASTMGTVISLLSVIMTRISEVGTYDYVTGNNQKDRARKQKKQAIIGICFIVLGGALQIISVIL